MFHGISIVVQGSSQTVIWQVIPYAIKLSMWHEKNEYAWFKFEKGKLSKYTRQTWNTLHR